MLGPIFWSELSYFTTGISLNVLSGGVLIWTLMLRQKNDPRALHEKILRGFVIFRVILWIVSSSREREALELEFKDTTICRYGWGLPTCRCTIP